MANTISPERGTSGAAREWQTGQGSAVGAAGAVQEGAQRLASSVAEAAQDAWDKTRQAAATVADTAGGAWDETIACMRRYPAAPFVAGVALGALLAAAWVNRPSTPGMIRGMESAGRDPHRPYGS